jgi:hypothetical protein
MLMNVPRLRLLRAVLLSTTALTGAMAAFVMIGR